MKKIFYLLLFSFLALNFLACSKNSDDFEDTLETCSDGIDNNANGKIDCDDQTCMGAGMCGENTKELCSDGIDNNGNGQADCADDDCAAFCKLEAPKKHASGVQPDLFNYSNLEAQYQLWYDKFYEESEDGVMARIKRDDEQYTVSEGIGYGMLIFLGMNKPEEFQKLWNYYKNFENSRGVMNWCIERFDKVAEPCDHNGSSGKNGATDAELDVITALIIGARKWNNAELLADAKVLAQSIFTSESNYGNAAMPGAPVRPGDAWGTPFNPSYISLVALKLMEEIQPENPWSEVLANNANYLFNICLPLSQGAGLFPDWADQNCLETDYNWGGAAGYDYGYEAFRTVMRIAWYYLWYSDAASMYSSYVTASWINNYTGGDVLLGPGLGIAITGTTDAPKKGKFGLSTMSYCLAATVETPEGINFKPLVEQCNHEFASDVGFKYYDGSLKLVTMLLYSGDLAYIAP